MHRRNVITTLVAIIKTPLIPAIVLAAEGAATKAGRLVGAHWSVNGEWSPSFA